MVKLIQNIGLTILGIVIGFGGKYFLAVFNARNELKKDISAQRASYYIERWKLCEHTLVSTGQTQDRSHKLREWYNAGGGLLLQFKATNRLLRAIKLLKNQNEFKPASLEQIREDLTWLRTEMNYEVGAFSRREANTQLSSTKQI